MDCNSIVYDAIHMLEKQKVDHDVDFETLIINEVIIKIDYYIRLIQPTNSVFIAFDGVAPFAKMDQQRTRRYKTLFLSTVQPTVGKWNTSAITPGTAFMTKLCNRINNEFINSEKKYNTKQVIVSCSDEPGEGEHKLYNNIRTHLKLDDSIAVYGLDSDLIMLSIFHLKYCQNIYVFREAPEFLKSSIPVDTNGDKNAPHFLDINHLSLRIHNDMGCKFKDSHRTFDYVFLCFFLGNDFLPHFPAMNIRTHGITALLDIYRLCIGNHADRFLISKSMKIQWNNVSIFVNEIAKREHEFLINEYFVRNKNGKRTYLETTPEEKEAVLNNAPIIYRADEFYICPDEPYWETRYYTTLFHSKREPDNIKTICMNYLEGLEWVFKYYTEGCPDWKWKYNYHYPPLFVDLVKYIPNREVDLILSNNSTAFNPIIQLSYVLPMSNLHLLQSTKLEQFIKENHADLYPEKYDFKWAFCRYLWEAHPVLPNISIKLLNEWEKNVL
jgi:5'-3' exonuclease